eukprot:gnl/TRDRNA2_/TRDRNA2_145237_c1_seq1.p1 gnl/TRDRNA2_/TRDRNA2_145237_c1~~gnl/TRDRNA2_/TRDRNA2_145237_c1_seq1.p1  ORF type:complete len:115 (+),score=18.30 gnl/TRDRNA2_/TRDRNA2_145237_c1_seq1:2-346(+)
MLRDRLCNIVVPDWEGATYPADYSLKDSCNPTEEPVRMVFEVNSPNTFITLSEAEGASGTHPGDIIGAVKQRKRLTSKQQGFRDTVIFFAFTSTNALCGEECSFVGIERIDMLP